MIMRLNILNYLQGCTIHHIQGSIELVNLMRSNILSKGKISLTIE